MKSNWRKFLLILLMAIAVSCRTHDADIVAVKSLAKRVIPQHAYKFVFVKDATAAEDFFRLEQKGSRIVVTGNNANSMATGLNYYLKNFAHIHVSWFADEAIEENVSFPTIEEIIEKKALVDNRFMLNYCTYGYTMPWWTWREWERFIDWMALNGINMPLSQTGQEAVWYEVWQEFGMTDEEIRSYFSGPAHLPWHRMANLDGFQGPLPMEWIENQKELQKQIVARERELNMTTVLPAFAGHVPKKIAEMYPDADITQLSSWCGFEPTYFLNSQDSLFANIQAKFIAKQTELYGTSHVYGFDPFNEMDPPQWDEKYLADVSRNIYSSLQAADPEAEWLQMSWVFYYKRKQWTPSRLEAYLTAVPEGKMTLLDYFCENTEVWRHSDKFYGQPYIWCYLGNFGGNTMLVGDINLIHERLRGVLADGGDNLVGIGSTLEAFDVSPHTYQFLYDCAWDDNIDVAAWVDNWAALRSGYENINASMAWKMLNERIYKDCSYYGLGTIVNARPELEGHGTFYTKPGYSYRNRDLLDAWMLLISSPSESEHYNYDLVNYGSQLLGNHFMVIRDEFAAAYRDKDEITMNLKVTEANELLADLEALLSTHQSFLLGKWIADARAFGSTPESKDYYEKNARTILTIWGGPILNDYANRLWAGLVSDYYARRWNIFFDAVMDAANNDVPFDEEAFNEQLTKYENNWINNRKVYPAQPIGNTLEISKDIFNRWEGRISAVTEK